MSKLATTKTDASEAFSQTDLDLLLTAVEANAHLLQGLNLGMEAVSESSTLMRPELFFRGMSRIATDLMNDCSQLVELFEEGKIKAAGGAR